MYLLDHAWYTTKVEFLDRDPETGLDYGGGVFTYNLLVEGNATKHDLDALYDTEKRKEFGKKLATRVWIKTMLRFGYSLEEIYEIGVPGRIIYVCDKETPDCAGECSDQSLCSHTRNVGHAANFESIGSYGRYSEIGEDER